MGEWDFSSIRVFRGLAVCQGAFCVWMEPDLKRLLDSEGSGLPRQGGDIVPVSSLFCWCEKTSAQALSPPSLLSCTDRLATVYRVTVGPPFGGSA